MRMLLALCLAAASLSAQAEVYRWVDDNGVVHFGDRVPPEYAGQRREKLDAHGNVRAVTEREPTRAEREAAAARQQAEQAEQARRQHQARYERSLTATYATLEQLESAYRDRLDVLGARLQAAESTLADLRRELDNARAAASDGAPTERLRQARTNVAEQERMLERLREQRAELAARFERDRQRYIELTGG